MDGEFIFICWTVLTWPSVSAEQLNQQENDDLIVSANSDDITCDPPGMLSASGLCPEPPIFKAAISSLSDFLLFFKLGKVRALGVRATHLQPNTVAAQDGRRAAAGAVSVAPALTLSGNKAAL